MTQAVGAWARLVPVLRVGRPGLSAALADGARAGSGGRDRHRLRNAFATAQVALAFVLLVGSGLMIRTFRALLDVRPGFDRPEEVLTLRLSVPTSAAPGTDEAARMHEAIVRRIEAVPGVVSVGAGTSVAMSPWDSWDNIYREGRREADGETPHRRLNWITPDYFASLRNPVLAGRAITWDDVYQLRPVVMVTENLAREYWGDPSRALGNRISENRDGPWREIVGVVANEYTTGLNQEPPTVVYFLSGWWISGATTPTSGGACGTRSALRAPIPCPCCRPSSGRSGRSIPTWRSATCGR